MAALMRFAGLVAAASLALTACAPASNAAPAAPETDSPAGESVTIADAWVKSADEGMSAAFGQLVNDSGRDLTVTAAESPASTLLELHETVEDETGQPVMRRIERGFVIPAGGTLTLEPGADHIMLMDLTSPLRAGEEVTFVLTFADDSTLTFNAPVKDYSGANESYRDVHEHGDHGHGEADH